MTSDWSDHCSAENTAALRARLPAWGRWRSARRCRSARRRRLEASRVAGAGEL